MDPATAYIASWFMSGLAAVALAPVTVLLLMALWRRGAITRFPYTLALIAYPGAILYVAFTQVREAASNPGAFTTLHLAFPLGALAVCAALGFAEWRYVASNPERQ
jgi:hypothetical protein